MNLRQLLLAYTRAEEAFNKNPSERYWLLQDMAQLENEIVTIILQPTNPYTFGDVYAFEGKQYFIDADNENRIIIAEVTTHTLPSQGEITATQGKDATL